MDPLLLNSSADVDLSSIYIYRAPIAGNPWQDTKTINNGALPIQVDFYAIDPLTRRLWLYLESNFNNWGWASVTASDYTSSVKILKPDGCLWTSDDNYTGNDRIEIAPQPVTGGNVQIPLARILDIVSNGITNASSNYPIANVGWPTSGLPSFTLLPVTLKQMCSSTRYELHGLGYYIGSGSPYHDPNSHPGLDWFAPQSSNVYSIGDGIVVGIGVEGKSTLSADRWGADQIQGGNGYSLIIRYGHLYVLYGHLLSLDYGIYVGAHVHPGDYLAELGTFPNSEPHLHLEVRSFGADILADALVQDYNGNDNQYGILRLNNPTQAPNVYDIAQFFSSSVKVTQTDTVSSSISVFGLTVSITDLDSVTFGTPTVTLNCTLSQPFTLEYLEVI